MFLDWKKQYCENDYTTQIIYRFDTIPVKLPMAFFHRIRAKIFAVLMETQRPQVGKAVLRKKNEAGEIRFPDFRIYYWVGQKVCYIRFYGKIKELFGQFNTELE